MWQLNDYVTLNLSSCLLQRIKGSNIIYHQVTSYIFIEQNDI
jgi:hypothetical protein